MTGYQQGTASDPARLARWRWLHRFGSSPYVYQFAARYSGMFGAIALVLFLVGAYLGLVVAPADYQMGDSYRIIYIHVPGAWMSMFAYVVMAMACTVAMIWKLKMGFAVARAIAPIGAVLTFIALFTGALWGKPTWGTYWIWDARLTSELILLFLYLGYIVLANALADREQSDQAAAILAMVGVVNIPIIHYSVVWWNTLHQGATVSQFGRPTMDTSMLIPLLIMFAAANFYFLCVMLKRLQNILLEREQNTRWAKDALGISANGSTS